MTIKELSKLTPAHIRIRCGTNNYIEYDYNHEIDECPVFYFRVDGSGGLLVTLKDGWIFRLTYPSGRTDHRFFHNLDHGIDICQQLKTSTGAEIALYSLSEFLDHIK